MRTDFVLDALERAFYARQPGRDSSVIHYSDRWSQYVSLRYGERLAEAGVEPLAGIKGDGCEREAYPRGATLLRNGIYKAELTHR